MVRRRTPDPRGLGRFTFLPLNDWSMHRSVGRSSNPLCNLFSSDIAEGHSAYSEWVYNHPDIMHSHVIWARDLGADHNQLLLNLLPDRTVWLLQADARQPQLIPYAQAPSETESPSQEIPGRSGAESEDPTN